MTTAGPGRLLCGDPWSGTGRDRTVRHDDPGRCPPDPCRGGDRRRRLRRLHRRPPPRRPGCRRPPAGGGTGGHQPGDPRSDAGLRALDRGAGLGLPEHRAARPRRPAHASHPRQGPRRLELGQRHVLRPGPTGRLRHVGLPRQRRLELRRRAARLPALGGLRRRSIGVPGDGRTAPGHVAVRPPSARRRHARDRRPGGRCPQPGLQRRQPGGRRADPVQHPRRQADQRRTRLPRRRPRGTRTSSSAPGARPDACSSRVAAASASRSSGPAPSSGSSPSAS